MKSKIANKKSKVGFLKGIMPKLFGAEYSHSKFKIPADDNSEH